MLRIDDKFALSLQSLDGSFHFLPKAQLAQVDIGSRSLMPASTLDGKQVDDLISYLLKTGDESSKHSPTHSAKDDDNN